MAGRSVVDLLLFSALALTLMVLSSGSSRRTNFRVDEKPMHPFPLNIIASVIYNSSDKVYSIVVGTRPDAVAWANFTDHINNTGWAHLTVTTNEAYPDPVQAYAAGLIEGNITAPYMYMNWMNTISGFCQVGSKYCTDLSNFLTTNMDWMKTQIAQQPDDPYFHQLNLLLIQLTGMGDGFQRVAGQPRIDIDPFGFLLFQIGGDMEDLESALKKPGKKSRMMGDGHCSALVKLLPGNKDLYVSQDTWNSYVGMLRILKKYDFSFHQTESKNADVIPGQAAAFSSAPGMLYSGDDFYIINSGLVTIETTIGNNNDDLWKYVQPSGQVLEWARNVVANRLAVNGSHWAEIFSKFNSGTYNNQWTIVDYNKFTPNQPPEDGLLVVLEQIPGTIVTDDLTYYLREHSYFPSYNTPFFKEIYRKSGWPALRERYGDWFSYNNTARANIFRRNQTQVTDFESMIRLMRFNNFKEDPLSACDCSPPYSGENSIASRSDLNPANGNYPFSALGHRNHGATDMKLTASCMIKSLAFTAQCGPTFDQQPPFQWSKSDFNRTLHLGHPDIFDFKPITVIWAED